MTDIEVEEEQTPVAHVTVVYNGPAAPHWELRVRYGDQKLVDDFWARVTARLLLLPKHDPQFRRNRERVNRDAERELIICDWDLGDEDGDSNKGGRRPGSANNGQAPAPAAAPAAVEAADAEATEPAADEPDTEATESAVDADATAEATAESDDTSSEDSAQPATSEEE